MDVTTTILRHVGAGAGSSKALSFEDQTTWTYDDLAQQVFRHANALLELGVGRGDRVGILLKNSLEYWAAYLAIGRIGAVSVRLNWRLAPKELEYALTDSEASCLFVHDDLLATYGEILADHTGVRDVIVVGDSAAPLERAGVHSHAELIAAASAEEPDVERPSYDDPCMIMYTSGTTGFPKGARWTHGNTLWFSAMQSSYWTFNAQTVHFSSGPMFHVGGFEDWCLPTLTGGGHVAFLASGAFDIGRACEIARHHGATSAGLLPTMIYALLALPDVSGEILAGVDVVYTGGSPILRDAVDRLRDLFPNLALQQVYGLTEGGAIATVMDPAHLDEHLMSVGRPLPYAEVRVARLDDESVDAAPDEDGHLWVRSPAVCGMYHNKSEATEETFVDGWCRTGDLARITPDRFVYITGRVKDMIISGGENIYPVELENVLSTHPDVNDVAVIGVPDPKWGETPCAVVVRRPGSDPSGSELIAHVAANLAGYKKPKYVTFVEELPRNAAGKVLKTQLREQFESPAARQ
ncbi:AMP-binding protein [Nocardioides albidus]|uniref:AMP-binding protein n=1 Tax=Nocardioides albidus TaxID=1517589 RepID=UPI001305219C|nr:AMP-binding protein [Nocardioides albidus]